MNTWLSCCDGNLCFHLCSKEDQKDSCAQGSDPTYTQPGTYTLNHHAAGTVSVRMRGSAGGGAGGYANPIGFGAGGGGGGGGEIRETVLNIPYAFTLEIVVGKGGTGGSVNQDGKQGEVTQVFSRPIFTSYVQNYLELDAKGGKGGLFMSARGGDGAGGGGGGGVRTGTSQGGFSLPGGSNGEDGGNPNGGKGGFYLNIPGANGGRGSTDPVNQVLGGGGGGAGGNSGEEGEGGGIKPGAPNGSKGNNGARGSGGGGGAVYFPSGKQSPVGYAGGDGGGGEVSITFQ